MNRRQFFKTLAATAAGVAAVGVAPKVAVKGVPFKPNSAQAVIFDEFAEKTDYKLASEIWDATLKSLPPQQDPFRHIRLARYPYENQKTKTR